MFPLDAYIESAALAYRGYNVTNLGRTAEFLSDPRYHGIAARWLNEASAVCAEIVERPVDLVARVRRGEETTLATYDEAIALIVAVEMAQIEALREVWQVDATRARMAFGYSLGELTALAGGGVLPMREALRIPLAMAADCVALAENVTMGVVFSRGAALELREIERICLRVNVEGRGVIGVSSILSPNSVLVLGQQDTVDRLEKRLHEAFGKGVVVRRNSDQWPPLHTPLVWERNIPNRAGVLMHTLQGGFCAPRPKVLSLTTGNTYYDDVNARDLIQRWIDHPQRLWDGICETLSEDVNVVIHIGPGPNLVPATFERLATNVSQQMRGRGLANLSKRAVGGIAQQAWLRALLPSRAALFRAPQVVQVILEDWLLTPPT